MIRQKTPQLGGRKVWLRDDEGSSDRQVWSDTFVGKYHVPPPIPPPMYVLDLGSNIGLTCAHYKHMWPDATVVGVEMDAGNIEVARKNFDGPIHHHAVVQQAQEGIVRYQKQGLREEAYSLRLSLAGTERVMGYSMMSTMISAFGTVRIDLVKMDIEGVEWGVITDAAWAFYVRHLIVELHGEYTNEEATADLEFLGFQVRPSTHPRGLFAWRTD